MAFQAPRQGQRRLPGSRGEVKNAIPGLGIQRGQQHFADGRDVRQPHVEFLGDPVPVGLIIFCAHGVSLFAFGGSRSRRIAAGVISIAPLVLDSHSLPSPACTIDGLKAFPLRPGCGAVSPSVLGEAARGF